MEPVCREWRVEKYTVVRVLISDYLEQGDISNGHQIYILNILNTTFNICPTFNIVAIATLVNTDLIWRGDLG